MEIGKGDGGGAAYKCSVKAAIARKNDFKL